MTTLNDAQERAAAIRAAHTAVIAGPGSGKSSTLVERLRRLTHEDCPASETVVLTFTNAGAKVLSDRLQQRGIRPRYVGTLHGYGFRLLNRHGQRIGYRAGGVNLMTEDDATELLLTCARELGYKGAKTPLLKLMRSSDGLPMGDLLLIWQEYQHRLKRNNTVDYGAVLASALRLLQIPDVAEAEKMEELLVDEAQDSAAVDWEIYYAIRAARKFVVGDPDQSVFGFRGAWPQGFYDYAMCVCERDNVITLDLNYRSGIGVCRAATKLIGHNTGRIEKAVVPAVERGDILTHFIYENERDERTKVRLRISTLLDSAVGIAPRDIAVLLRRNDLVAQFRENLESMGIPVQGSADRPPLPQDWREGIEVLSLFHDPRNDMVAERIIRRLAPDKLEGIKVSSIHNGRWFSVSAFRAGVFPEHPVGLAHNIPDTALLSAYGISREMVITVQERIAMLPQPEPTLADLLHDLFDHDKWSPAEQREGVWVGTLHAAKGREWPVVFMPCMEEGILPALRKETGPAEIEEERRLCFVGMTRAQQQLRLSWAQTRFAWGKVTEQKPSRFIAEAGL